MFFTCPSCNTVYDVPTGQVDAAKKFRCAKCGCVWEPEADEKDEAPAAKAETEEPETAEESESLVADDSDAPLEPEDAPDFGMERPENTDFEPDFSAFKPIFQQPEKEPVGKQWIKPLFGLSFIFLAVAVYTFVFRAPARYPVSFQSLSPEFVEKDYQRELFLNTTIQNDTVNPVTIRSFKVYFYDQAGKEIMSDVIRTPDLKLDGEENRTEKLAVGRPPARAVRAVVEVNELTEQR